MESKKSKFYKKSKGVTGDYFTLGLILFGVGIYFISTELFYLGFPLIYFGFLIMLSFKVLIIDLINMKVKHYYSFFPFKIGKWHSITSFESVELRLRHEVASGQTAYGAFYEKYSIRTRHFEIYLNNSNNDKLELIDFSEYSIARKVLCEIAVKLNLNAKDLFEESVIESRNRRH